MADSFEDGNRGGKRGVKIDAKCDREVDIEFCPIFKGSSVVNPRAQDMSDAFMSTFIAHTVVQSRLCPWFRGEYRLQKVSFRLNFQTA
jgi:hypothetical protein